MFFIAVAAHEAGFASSRVPGITRKVANVGARVAIPDGSRARDVDSLIDPILSKAGRTTVVFTTSNLADVIQEAKIASAEHAAQEAVREAV